MTSPIHITVTSTVAGVAPSVVRACIDSVRGQDFAAWRHVYVVADATDDNPPWAFWPGREWCTGPEGGDLHDARVEVRKAVYPMAPVLANLWPIWRALPDDEVIVWLDGDDGLATPLALSTVARAHARGALATYGQFMWADGSIGFAGQVGNDPRNEHWRATHLKTFRAGLVKRLREEDLKTPDGEWTFVTDQPVMLPILEMAGPRAVFIPNILHLYSVPNLETELKRHDPAYVAKQHAEVMRVRALPRYERLSKREIEQMLSRAA